MVLQETIPKQVSNKWLFLYVGFLLWNNHFSCADSIPSQPNIVFILADDYGWNDVGYHGSEIKTPVLDQLAADGVKLENYYVQPICSPTRSQLLSGRYQIHTGLQHSVIRPCVPTALPLSDQTIAEKLKLHGYSTHLVGKWHLGFYKEEYMPTRRGFDTHYGYLTGEEDYYTRFRRDPQTGFSAFDFRDGADLSNSSYGLYSAHAFSQRTNDIISKHNRSQPLFLYNAFQSVHAPLQVPHSYIKPYTHIKDSKRRVFAGMVSALDEAVGSIVDSLKAEGLWENTLLVFSTDNGGPVNQGANNAPLRGSKATYWEGGVRGVGFVSGPLVSDYKGTVNHQLLHVSDWFPTLTRLAGGSVSGAKLDGFDQWVTIIGKQSSPRKEILYNIDPRTRTQSPSVSKIFDTSVQAALRYGDWKILTGDPGFAGWVPEPTSASFSRTQTDDQDISSIMKPDSQNVFLFNVTADPEERKELSKLYPQVVEQLLHRLAWWNSSAVPVNYPPVDKNCNPALSNNFWGPWM